MFKYIQNIIILVFVIQNAFCFAQDERRQTNDTLDSDVVNIVKPYTPKVSDAFKIKVIPRLDDTITNTKKKISYNIFSIPVASTFTPAKGKATSLEKRKNEKTYNNYASIGFGSYTTVLGDVFLNQAISRTEIVGGYISHHSSQGEIDGIRLDNNFSDSKARINYVKNMRDLSWEIDLGIQHQIYNWYGTSSQYTEESMFESIDPKHVFFTVDLGGYIDFDNGLLNNGNLRFTRFSDDYESSENRFYTQANLNIPISDDVVKTDIIIDYLAGDFDSNYFTNDALEYANLNIGITPIYQIKKDEFTVNLGFSIFYLNNIQENKNSFYIYPKVTTFYNLVNEILVPYAGIEGGLKQNTYRDFASQNPFVSPTLLIQPTDQQYDAYIGLKGKLSNNISYNLRGTYYAENDKALFKNNTFLNASSPKNYTYGNSFQIVYDDVSTLSVFGEMNFDFSRNFKVIINAEYLNYSTNNENEAWNLPDFKASLFLDYQINNHWYAGANVFYVGERKAQETLEGGLLPIDFITYYNLKSYIDANAHIGYRVNDRFSVFTKVNNIANQDYQKWLNFPVQGIQFLAGASYKFDF